jgi:uncharacterized membrane protein YhiD involved in acid resistance
MPDWLETIVRDPEWEALLRVLIAGAVAVLIGIEREREGKPAGARTYGLVAMGAAIFTVTGIYGFGEADPGARIAAQIVTGIGFIGAGTILHMRRRVIGLTTAAGLWVAAAVGMAIGAGLFILGIGAAIFMFILLQFLRPEWLISLGLASAEDVEGVTRHADDTSDTAEADKDDAAGGAGGQGGRGS